MIVYNTIKKIATKFKTAKTILRGRIYVGNADSEFKLCKYSTNTKTPNATLADTTTAQTINTIGKKISFFIFLLSFNNWLLFIAYSLYSWF